MRPGWPTLPHGVAAASCRNQALVAVGINPGISRVAGDGPRHATHLASGSYIEIRGALIYKRLTLSSAFRMGRVFQGGDREARNHVTIVNTSTYPSNNEFQYTDGTTIFFLLEIPWPPCLSRIVRLIGCPSTFLRWLPTSAAVPPNQWPSTSTITKECSSGFQSNV